MWSLGDLVGQLSRRRRDLGPVGSPAGRRALSRASSRPIARATRPRTWPRSAGSPTTSSSTRPASIAAMRGELAAARARGRGVRRRPAPQPDAQRGRGPEIRPRPAALAPRLPGRPARPEHLEGVDGLHVHSLCEQDFAPLRRTWEALEPRHRALFRPAQVAQFRRRPSHHPRRLPARRSGRLPEGGARGNRPRGHLEPGEAIALDAGILVGEVRRHVRQRHADRRSSTSRPPATCPT